MGRHLIVNADDFGASDAVNAGVVAAHDDGIVTSASLMVRGAAVADAVELAKARPGLSSGCTSTSASGSTTPTRRLGRALRRRRHRRPDAVGGRGATAARRRSSGLPGAGRRTSTAISTSSVTSRRRPSCAPLPSGWRSRSGCADQRVTHRGDFYGQGPRGEPHHEGVTAANLVSIIASVPDGWTELGCHPGIGSRSGHDGVRRRARASRSRRCAPRRSASPSRRTASSSPRSPISANRPGPGSDVAPSGRHSVRRLLVPAGPCRSPRTSSGVQLAPVGCCR